jgi:hypothetical protein
MVILCLMANYQKFDCLIINLLLYSEKSVYGLVYFVLYQTISARNFTIP